MSNRIAALEKMIRGDAPAPPVARLVVFRLLSVAHGESLFGLDATEAHWNPMGTLHGGILCDVADAAIGVAFASTLEDDESFTTLELKINFLRPVWTDKLMAVGKVVKRGAQLEWSNATSRIPKARSSRGPIPPAWCSVAI